MKSYILTYVMAWAIFTTAYAGLSALTIAMLSFLFWHIPDVIAYLPILRWATLLGFATTLLYMPSEQGKEALKAVEGIWK